MNKVIIAAALLAVSSAVSAQQQTGPTTPIVQGDNPRTRTTEGGSSVPATPGATAAQDRAQGAAANRNTRNTDGTARNADGTMRNADGTTRNDTVARAPRSDRN